ncbi:MAG: hypothetical protein HUU28_08415 [Planctomycetaceae bacterium]|nr:hypothetical protein [Planctomycetaceae bacterium]
MRRLAVLTLAFGLVSCGNEPAPDSTPKPAPSTVFVVADSDAVPAGTLRGHVHLIGEAPVLPPLALGASDGCGTLRTTAPTERLLVSEGRVANVLLRVKSGPPLASVPVPTESVVLDQKGCVFEPHVVVVRTGQPLAVHNSDPLVHNVHVQSRRNENSNRTLGPGTVDHQIVFTSPEISIPVRCDIHPWMQAFVHVVETPHFALTGADGTFELRGLVPGDYEFELTHEWLGRFSFRATLGAGRGLEAQLGLRVPAP